MKDGEYDPDLDDGATVLILRPEDEDSATLLQAPKAKPPPEPHRTPEESDDTASDEYRPLRLDLTE